MKDLQNLQIQRTKANKKRKPYWQKRIDDHFLCNDGFKSREVKIVNDPWRKKN